MVVVCLSPNGVDAYATPAPPRRLLVGTMQGVIELSLQDSHWRITRRALTEHHVSALMTDAGGAIFAGTHDAGLHVSRDGGAHWTFASATFETRNIFTLARTAGPRGEILYAGCEPALIYRSRDGGYGWEELDALRSFPTRPNWNFPAPPHIAHVKHVTADPRDQDVLYVSIEQGALLKSRDGGAGFEELHFQDAQYVQNRDVHRIVFTPGNPDEIYLDGGDGIARSRDAGRTWERIATPRMRVGYPDQLFVSPDDDNTLFVVGAGVPPNIWRQTGDARSTIARSDDRGGTWRQLAGGLPENIPGNLEAASLVRWDTGFGFVAGTTDGDVFSSDDKGESWERIACGLPPISKCIHHRNLTMGRAASAGA